jgi:RNA polymerase sigma factor (TIGR02999 family)
MRDARGKAATPKKKYFRSVRLRPRRQLSSIACLRGRRRTNQLQEKFVDAVSSQNITRLLQAWSEGDAVALERLMPLIYDELYRLARSYMNRELPGHQLQATALVNEAYLRLANWKEAQWDNRAHFFGVTAQLMRRVLVDFARERQYEKHGGGKRHVALDEALPLAQTRDEDLVALDDALESLAQMDARKALIVELKFFGGLSVEETAEVLKLSERTVMREWSLARAWLFQALNKAAL